MAKIKIIQENEAELFKKITDAIILKADSDIPRNYLGMSEIGHPCEAKLWLSFRNFKSSPMPYNMHLIYEFGKIIETEIIQYLTDAGYKISDTQQTYHDFNGLFQGHCDGIIEGVTKQKHILEIKSTNDRRFKLFKEHGVYKTSVQYFAQCQCYMGYSGLDRCLFVAVNKNTGEIYLERIYFNKKIFEDLKIKAINIITSNIIPPKNEDECFFCNFKMICHANWYGKSIPIKKETCCNCDWFQYIKTPICTHEKHKIQIKTWGIKCNEYTPISTTRL